MGFPSGCRIENELQGWEGVAEAGTPRWWLLQLSRCEGTWTKEKSGNGREPSVGHGMDSIWWVTGCGEGEERISAGVTGWLGVELVPELGEALRGASLVLGLEGQRRFQFRTH